MHGLCYLAQQAMQSRLHDKILSQLSALPSCWQLGCVLLWGVLVAETNGTVFQHIIRPFSARVAAFNADGLRPVIPDCQPLRDPYLAPSPAHIQAAGSSSHERSSNHRHTHPKRGAPAVTLRDSALMAAKAAPGTHSPSSMLTAAVPPDQGTARSPMQAPQIASSHRHMHPNTSAGWRAVFASTFTPQYDGLTASNVNARVSCHEGYQSIYDEVEK